MALETATTINQLVATNPVATDGLAEADDHLRLIKSTVKNTFPSVTGAITASHTEINTVADGDTAATATSLVDADRVVVNDDGTMVQVAMSDVNTYIDSKLSIQTAQIQDSAITTAKLADNSITAAKLASGAAFAAGMLMPFAGASAPSGWLMAYGQAISRTTYSDLFSAIGTTYGTGDGSTTFNLPDLRGRTIAGQDDMGGTSANRLTDQSGGLDGDALGATGGAETHTLTTAEMPSHNHTGNVNLRTNWEAGTSSLSPVGTGDARFDGSASSPSFTTDNTGGGGAHNNVQPTIILNYIIKT